MPKAATKSRYAFPVFNQQFADTLEILSHGCNRPNKRAPD